MMGKRRFGRVRALTSGRFQARYPGPDGVDRPAPETFASKTDAEVWLTLKEAEILNGDWINPDDGEVSLIEYARTWIEERPGLRPKTVDGCSYLLRKHLTPVLGPMPIADIKPGHVRRWRKQLLDKGVSAVTVAKAYRLLKAILNTAGEDLPDQGNGVVRDDEGDGQRHCGIQPVPPTRGQDDRSRHGHTGGRGGVGDGVKQDRRDGQVPVPSFTVLSVLLVHCRIQLCRIRLRNSEGFRQVAVPWSSSYCAMPGELDCRARAGIKVWIR